MSDPWVPPYFGSWEQLLQESLVNPFLGSGRGGRPYKVYAMRGPQPDPWRAAYAMSEPSPDPWRAAAAYILSALTIRDAAEKLADTRLRSNIAQQVNSALEQFIDDYCGTPPHPRPWPWAGPVPYVFPLVSELTLIANTLAPGMLKTSLEQISTTVLEKGFAGAPRAE